MILQPTRVVPRKGIELSIELIARLDDPHAHLMITSPAGDEGMEYLAQLHMAADRAGVDLRYVADRFGPVRRQRGRWRLWSLSDAYLEANLILYPSLYEGFGNALVEAVYFGKPLVVNRYAVYDADIAPLGFRFIEIREAITDETVRETRELVHDPERRAADAMHNYAIGARHLSYETLQERVARILATLPSPVSRAAT
jgi:mannosylglucosylglycerate synthase